MEVDATEPKERAGTPAWRVVLTVGSFALVWGLWVVAEWRWFAELDTSWWTANEPHASRAIMLADRSHLRMDALGVTAAALVGAAGIGLLLRRRETRHAMRLAVGLTLTSVLLWLVAIAATPRLDNLSEGSCPEVTRATSDPAGGDGIGADELRWSWSEFGTVVVVPGYGQRIICR